MYREIVAVVFVLCFVCMDGDGCRAESPDPIAVPAVNLFADSKDFEFSLPEKWMRQIQANLASIDHDVAVTAEFSVLRTLKGRRQLPVFNFVTFRRISAIDGTRRTICIVQSELEATEIEERNVGRIVDGARHCDLLVKDGVALVSFVNEGGFGLSEDRHPTTEEHMRGVLQRKMLFDPCRATTVGLEQIAAGQAMDLSRHSVLTSLVRGTLRRNGCDHVLLQTGSVKQILTFKKEVPVQMVHFVDVDEKSQKPIPFERTISRWSSFGEDIMLPTTIWAQREHRWNSGNMIAKLTWVLGDKVDRRMFSDRNLGEVSTVRNREL